ncbi:MAG TPA: mechanosensitive ion channel family protein [Candidatus Limnocylindria bacterium]|nr:mechanosensitive ion channel family protein [Candidatus Limnocylindria bacterium]
MSPATPFLLVGRLIPETEKLMDMGARIGLTLVVGFLIQRLLFLLVGRSVKWVERVGHGSTRARQRGQTIGQILRSLCTLVVAGAVIIHILAVLGWDVRPLIAGAGIISVALGFGAQTVVRDVIAGLFIIAEDQFGVGDLIEVNGKPATVEALTVRSTTLRDFNGFIHFVPNGEMKIVTNRSRGWNRFAVDVPVASDESMDRALEVCTRVVQAMNDDRAWRERLIDPIDVWGIETLSGNEVQVRIVLRARPGSDGPETARELRRRLLGALAQAGIRTAMARDVAITPWPQAPPPAAGREGGPLAEPSEAKR